MSRAFVKEPDGPEAGPELPELAVSTHRNLVTPAGLAQIEAEQRRLRELVGAARAAEDHGSAARHARDLRYWDRRRPPVGNRSGCTCRGSRANILRDRCTVEQIVAERTEASRRSPLPRCASCGGLLRPDVVWFGDMIPRPALVEADEAAADCDAFLSVGTSSLVYPAAGLAEEAVRRGVPVIEVNPNLTDLSPRADVVLQGPAGRILPELLRALA